MPRLKLILALIFLLVAGASLVNWLHRPSSDSRGHGLGPQNASQNENPGPKDLPPWAGGANNRNSNPRRKTDEAGTASSISSCPEVEVELAEIRASPLFNSSSKLADMVLFRKFPELPADQIDRYLAENQRSPISLLVASQLSENPALLAEAAAAAPDDPLIQLELAWSAHDLPGKSSAIQALGKADPENSLKDLLWARWQFGQGDWQGAISTLEGASPSPSKLDVYAKRLTDAIAGAYQSSGLSETEAYYAALSSYGGERRRFAIQLCLDIGTHLAWVQESIADGPSLLASRMFVVNASRSSQASAHTLTDALLAHLQESFALKDLPGDTSIDASGRTVAARQQELKDEMDSIRSLQFQDSISLRSMDEKLLNDYLRVFKASGEREAERWSREAPAGSPSP